MYIYIHIQCQLHDQHLYLYVILAIFRYLFTDITLIHRQPIGILMYLGGSCLSARSEMYCGLGRRGSARGIRGVLPFSA